MFKGVKVTISDQTTNPTPYGLEYNAKGCYVNKKNLIVVGNLIDDNTIRLSYPMKDIINVEFLTSNNDLSFDDVKSLVYYGKTINNNIIIDNDGRIDLALFCAFDSMNNNFHTNILPLFWERIRKLIKLR